MLGQLKKFIERPWGYQGGKGSAPPPPDYAGAARETAAGNLDAARATVAGNRVNQITPQGNLTYAVTGQDPYGNPTWTATQTYSPEQQALYEGNINLSKGLLNSAQTGLGYANDVISHPGVDTSKLPQMPISPGQSYIDAYNKYMQPNWDRQQEMTDAQLANQGITRGSEAYTNAQRDLHDLQARDQLAAVTTGMNTGLNANQQGFQQAAYNQMQPINVINALRTGSQVQAPNYVNPAQQNPVAGADILGATNAQYQNQLGAYNAQQAAGSNFMGGLMQLGGAVAPLMFSDKRLKRNIKRVGTHKLGIGIYQYEYVWGEHAFGVMADEVEQVMPEAVITHPSGFKMVDYGRI